MSREVLLISSHPDDASFAAAVALSAGVSLSVHPDPRDAARKLVTSDPMATIIDVTELKNLRAFESEIQKTVGIFSDKVSLNKMYLVSDKALSDSREVVLSPLFGTFYKRPKAAIEESGTAFGRFVSASDTLSTADISKYLAEKAKVQTVTLSNTNQKLDAVEAVRKYLVEAKFQGRIASLISNAVDELLMNAMYDAPVDELGKQLYTMTARNQNRALTGKSSVLLKLGFDGDRVGISVTDFYGSVDRQKLLNHVSSNYNRRAYMISATNAGAGLGVANVFRSGGSLSYLCESGIKTESTLLYKVTHSYREFKDQFRFFSAQFIV